MKCDCGWSFVTNEMAGGGAPDGDEQAVREARRSAGSSQIALGVGLLVIGVLITVATYSSVSTSGGTYILAYGPILVGVIKIVRGLRQRES